MKTLLFALIASAAIAKADISPSTIAHFKEWAKAHRTSFIQSYSYSAEQKAFIETPAVDNDEFVAVARAISRFRVNRTHPWFGWFILPPVLFSTLTEWILGLS